MSFLFLLWMTGLGYRNFHNHSQIFSQLGISKSEKLLDKVDTSLLLEQTPRRTQSGIDVNYTYTYQILASVFSYDAHSGTPLHRIKDVSPENKIENHQHALLPHVIKIRF